MDDLNDLKRALAENAGLDLNNKAKGLCVACGRPALDNCYSDAGRREFEISGMCEKCFDAATAEVEYDPDLDFEDYNNEDSDDAGG